MYFRLTATVMAVLLSVCVFAQSKKQIKALKVKSATETTTTFEGGKQKASWKSSYEVFDKEGNTLEQTDYNSDGSVRRKETAKYSGKNKVEEVIQHDGKTDSDQEDNQAERKYKKTTFKYNANGDKTEEALYDEKGALIKKTVYAYNGSGDKVLEMEYNASSQLQKKITYTYNGKGLRTEKKVFGPGEVLQKQIVYTYTF